MPVIIDGTNGISGVDGSASTPAVQGTDTNTGMFFPAADTIAFAEGGTEVMRIDSSGNLRVGSSSTALNSINSTNTFGFKNRIINGAMQIDQRNAGASVTPTVSNTYTLDRFTSVLSQASKYSVQQNAGSVTPPEGFTNYLGTTSLSAYTVGSTEVFCIRHQIEGYNVADLDWGTANAKTVTLSFWVRSSLTGTFGGSLRNSGGSRSYPFSYTISSANTWEQKSITIVGDTTGTWLTTNGVGISLSFSLASGSTFSGTAGAWTGNNLTSVTGATSVVGTNGATFYITGVQLEKGSTATSFDYRPYGTELQLCQRYYQQNIAANGYSIGTTLVECTIAGVVSMRATPTVALVNGTNALLDYGVATRTISSIGSLGYSDVNGGDVQVTSATTTNAKPHYVLPNRFSLSAEL